MYMCVGGLGGSYAMRARQHMAWVNPVTAFINIHLTSASCDAN